MSKDTEAEDYTLEPEPSLYEGELVDDDGALEAEFLDSFDAHMLVKIDDRDLRAINRDFTTSEYNESWTKIERYLFIEIYNIIKDFYISKDDSSIQSMTEDNITIKLPISLISTKLIKTKNRVTQLMEASAGLMSKQIRLITEDATGQKGFDFITIFPRITYDPSKDKKHMFIRIQSEIYEKMVPIEKFALLNLKLIDKINKGNSIRLYEIFKSNAFRRKFSIKFDDLRKQLGFYRLGVHKEWKHFNYQVLQVAVNEINSRKEYDIEVSYEKKRGSDKIDFTVITHAVQKTLKDRMLSLDAPIDPDTRQPNMLQNKYIDTTMNNCRRVVDIANPAELREWIISDLINFQKKAEQNSEVFEFKRAMNAISKQVRMNKYSEPYSHKYLGVNEKDPQFDDKIYRDIKSLEYQGNFQEIRNKFTDAVLIANRCDYLIEMFEIENIQKAD